MMGRYTPKVSVTMPAYNAEHFIAEAIESIVNQTYKFFELVIIDNGSTDNTFKIASDYAKSDDRIRVIRKTHGGISSGRNRALQEARGEWIAVMDADDVSLPNRLERQLCFVEQNPDVVVATSYVYNIDDKGRIIAQYTSKLTNRESVANIADKNGLIRFHHSAVLMRKDVIMNLNGYRSQFDMIEDCDLWNRVYASGHSILVQPEFLVKYRIHSEAASVSQAHELTLKLRWLRECMIHLRRGEAEPTWDEFIDKRKNSPLWGVINENRIDLGKIFYKRAVSKFAQDNFGTMTANLLVALILSPYCTLNRIWAKYLVRKIIGPAAERGTY